MSATVTTDQQQLERRHQAARVDFGPDQQAVTSWNCLIPQSILVGVGLVPLYPAIVLTPGVNLWPALCVLLFWTLPWTLVAFVKARRSRKYLYQLLGPWLHWRLWRLTGKSRRQPIAGATVTGDTLAPTVVQQEPPPELAHVLPLEYTLAGGRRIGLLFDRLTHTYSIVLKIERSAPGIGGLGQLEDQMLGWDKVLRAVANTAEIRRLQWLTVATPDDGTRLNADFQRRAKVQTGPAADAYDQLTKTAGPTTTIHDTYVVVQVEQATGTDEDRLDGTVFAASAGKAVHAAQQLAHNLQNGGWLVTSDGLGPYELGRMLRLAFCPGDRELLELQGQGVPLARCWPPSTQQDWNGYNTAGSRHETYEMLLPTGEVYGSFLDHLTTLAGHAHVLSVTYQALPRDDEIRKAEIRRSTSTASDHRRHRSGRQKSMKTEQQEATNVGLLGELLGGAAPYRVSAWVSLTAFIGPADEADGRNYHRNDTDVGPLWIFSPSRAVRQRLKHARTRLFTAATDAQITLVPCNGVQAQAFQHTLPLAQGVEGFWL